jgi:hypothetical protein
VCGCLPLTHVGQVRSSLPLLRSLLRCRSVRLTLTIQFEEHGTIDVRRSRRGRKMSTKRQKLLRNKENVIRFNSRVNKAEKSPKLLNPQKQLRF